MSNIPYPSTGIIREVTFEASTPEHFTTISTTNTNGTRDVHLILTKGTGERESPTSNRAELHALDGRYGAREIFSTQNDAIAYFLAALETEGFCEREAYELLDDAGLDMESYEEYLSKFSMTQRARRLIEDSKERARFMGHPLDYVILSPPDHLDYSPTWRSVDPSDNALNIASDLLAGLDRRCSCYQTTFEALLMADDGRLSYCEGLAMGKHPARASTHAWLELDDEVIELYWPWNGPNPPDDAVYYGDKIEVDSVFETFRRRPTAASVLFSDETYYQMPSVKRAIADGLSAIQGTIA